MLQLPPDAFEAIAQRAAELVLEQLEERAQGASLPAWLSVADAAAYIGCGKQRIYQLRSDGRLGAHKEGGRAVVLRAELDALVDVAELADRRSAMTREHGQGRRNHPGARGGKA